MLRYPFKEPISGFTHLFAAVLAFFGTIWLASSAWGDALRLIAVVVFGLSLVSLYAASSALHLINSTEQVTRRLRCYDHAAIYIGIAGGYTPFVYHLLDGEWRWIMLMLIWILALIGLIVKLFFFWAGHLSTMMYVLMGWIGIIAFPQIASDVASTGLLMLILAGGLTYTLGAIVYAMEKPNFHVHFGHHELWHLFVMGGSAFHFAAVVSYIV